MSDLGIKLYSVSVAEDRTLLVAAFVMDEVPILVSHAAGIPLFKATEMMIHRVDDTEYLTVTKERDLSVTMLLAEIGPNPRVVTPDDIRVALKPDEADVTFH